MIDMREVLRGPGDMRRVLRGESAIPHDSRRRRVLGVETVEGILTEVERNQILDMIDATDVKATAVNNWATSNGANLAELLGNWAGTWNTAWNKATLYSPTINNISLALSSNDATQWTWDPTKESALQNWMMAINQLYQIMQNVVAAPPVPQPVPGPGPGPQPPPPAPAPTSGGFPWWGWLLGALGLTAVVGGVAVATK